MKNFLAFALWVILLLISCNKNIEQTAHNDILDFGQYRLARVNLNIDLSKLSEREKEVILNLIKASVYADSIFLYQAAGPYAKLYDELTDSLQKLRFKINFGPWDRFNNNIPFVEGIGSKPKGANFYPQDMVESEFRQFPDVRKYSHYTLIRRDSNGQLYVLPYHKAFKHWLEKAEHYIQLAIINSSDSSLTQYLDELMYALQNDKYIKVDSLWTQIKGDIDFVLGPVYISEDKLFNLKAEHQAYVLLKDHQWTERLQRYTQWLRFLQKALPVPEEYRREEPSILSQMYVYDILFYGGSAHAGPITFSITLPFEPKLRMLYGGKTMLFKNVIFEKYHAIAKPLAKLILIPSQAKFVSDTAFLINTLFWEMASNLGIQHTVNKGISVRQALKNYYNVMEMIKNNLLVLFLVEKLASVDEVRGDLKNYYYTFVIDLIRQMRWGSEDEQSLAALVIFNYLYSHDAIDFLPTGELILHYDAIKKNIYDLITKVLIIQGDGNYQAAAHLILKNKNISPKLHRIFDKIAEKKIPIDIYIQQGVNNLKIN